MSAVPDEYITDPDIRANLEALAEEHCKAAREDPNAFCTFVLKDDESNMPIIQSDWHMEWQALATQHRRLIIWSHVESGKTSQLSIGRVLWELGKNPDLRICVLSNTASQATKICMTIGRLIEESSALHHVFPHLKKDKKMPWTRTELYVKRKSQSKDPSVRALGVHGNILGGRIDLLIVDDILDYENTLSSNQRDDLDAWFNSTVEGRLTKNSQVWFIGNAWHQEDIMHRYAAHESWFAVRYPVVNPDGSSTWEEQWPIERIDQKRKDIGAIEFARQMMCLARSDEEARFKQEWIEQCLRRGEGRQLAHALQHIPHGYRTYTGVDLGVRVKSARKKRKKPDMTSLFTICVHPNGDRELLDITSGRWAGPEIVKLIVDMHYRYHSTVIVENNAAQDFIVQFTKAMSAVPVKPFNTGTNKYHPAFGIEGIATEMYNSKWIIPSKNGTMHPEVRAWVNDMLYYDPAAHPGDRLMASWFAREGARMVKPKVTFGKIDTMSR